MVDEADSILIDEASTPLIIGALPTEEQLLAVDCYKWSSTVVPEFVEDDDYEYDHDKKTVELTREGRLKVRQLQKPPELDTVGMFNIYQYMERAIKVDKDYILDRQFVVRDGEVVIVDEFTGRLSEGEMARRHPPGRRGQGERRGDGRDRAGGPDHGPGLLPPLRAPGGNDRHRGQFGPASSTRSTAFTW